MSALRWLERLFLLVGIACLGWVGATWLEAYHSHGEQSRLLQAGATASTRTPPAARDALNRATSIGRLEIPRLDVSIVVISGDDDATLMKAVGHLPDTPFPWNGGNTAIAGHRDTFFKPLERVKSGDDIYLDTPRGRFHYRVRRTIVVEPEDLWVLDPASIPTLTLITCYPFRYIGPAPKRFIVQADRI
jgi:sortase A